jgi:hypothetical protein
MASPAEALTLDSFARQFRLRIRRDECGDPILPGKPKCGKSQLYVADSDGLCLMILDGPIANRSRWQAIGGKLWLGDISPDKHGRRVQDVKITHIPLENAPLAIRMARVPIRRKLSEAQRELLRKAGEPFQKRSAARLEPNA